MDYQDILKTSKFIKTIYDNEDIDELNYNEEVEIIFKQFIVGKKLNINYSTVTNLLNKFNKLNKSGMFTNFEKPSIKEYFCKQFNFLLLIDFIASFFKLDNANFDITAINAKFIFNFFIKLGDFFYFMNYLDVDENFTNYLKYMLVLYTIQLNRFTIETNYKYIIEILDDFFSNEIVPEVFKVINYKLNNKSLNNLENELNNTCFTSLLKELEPELTNIDSCNIDYTCETYDFLDNLFNYFDNTFGYTFKSDNEIITVKKTIVKIPNPEPNPNPNLDTDYDSDYDSDYDYDSDNDSVDTTYSNYDYYIQYFNRNQNLSYWTPTVKVKIPNIEQNDINYKKYRKQFILRKYQQCKNNYYNLNKEIKEISKLIKISDYSRIDEVISLKQNEKNNNAVSSLIEMKSIFGCDIDFSDSGILFNGRCAIYEIAPRICKISCSYGHLNNVINYVNFVKDKLSLDDIMNATESPNREIFKYILDNRKTYKVIDNFFNNYKSNVFYEPIIKFI